MKQYRDLQECRSALERFQPEVNNVLTLCHRNRAAARVMIRITAVGGEWLEGKVVNILGEVTDLHEGEEIAFPRACAFRLRNYLAPRHAA